MGKYRIAQLFEENTNIIFENGSSMAPQEKLYYNTKI
jgi:hypothetical protein